MGRSHLYGNNVVPLRALRSLTEALHGGSIGRMGHGMQSSEVMRHDQVEVVEREGTQRTVQLPRPSTVPTLFDPPPREYTEEDNDRLSRKMVGAAVDKAFTTTPFDGTNFRGWAPRFRMNARVTNLWEFFVTLQYPVTMVNGEMRDAIERLEVLQADYSRRVTLAFWVLLLSMSATIQLQLDVFQESYSPAFEAWEYLMETYQAKYLVAKVSLHRQLDNLKMGSQERVEKYINRATAIRDKLAMAGKMVDEDSFTLNLITGLPPHWKELRHSAMLDDISDSYTLQRMMIQEQRYQDLISKTNRDKRPPRMAGQTRGGNSPAKKKTETKGNQNAVKSTGGQSAMVGEKLKGNEGRGGRSNLVCCGPSPLPRLSASPTLPSSSRFPSALHSPLLSPLHPPLPPLTPPPIPQQPLWWRVPSTPSSAFGWCDALQWRHHSSIKAQRATTTQSRTR
ncbi:unnamed protein product [Closterium sp. NIES-54]